ncbi:MAG: hypothetical protein L3J82_04250 [Planctomycetes bacterium]|nr:hypothetical protein [Planctomycetota bacterium]
MQPIIITGPSANCGKTALACQLISAIPNAQALKITRFHRESNCPVHGVDDAGQDNCDGCAPAPDGFQLISDPEILSMSGKDTARMQNAGASKVLWLRAAPHVFEYAIKRAVKEFDPRKPLIVEGNSAATVADFQGTVIVAWPSNPRGIKESVLPALRRCDLFLSSCEGGMLPNSLLSYLDLNGLKVPDLPRIFDISANQTDEKSLEHVEWFQELHKITQQC